MAAAYDDTAAAWMSGPERAYRRFARALVAAAPVPLTGLRTLDLGAGTGVVSAELRVVGASPVALDASLAMLGGARSRCSELRVVAADATWLPLADGSFDAVLSGFLLNHLPEPSRLLEEAARVTRPEGLVMTMTFAAGNEHPVKAAVEAVAARWGWQAPAWHDEQKRWASLSDTPTALRSLAAEAGLEVSEVSSIEVDAGLRTCSEFVKWRLGMAQMAGFLSGLPQRDRQLLMAESEKAVAPHTQPLRRELLILSSCLPA
jgi:ubiquinone/menaquinone biosynthesis C-methylase UbiE